MVAHIVLFRPRPDLDLDARRSLVAALTQARRDIPSIRRFHVGRRIKHGRGYEAAMFEDFPYSAVIEFEDADGLRAYLEHPSHERLGTAFSTTVEAALTYDYEMSEDLDWVRREALGAR